MKSKTVLYFCAAVIITLLFAFRLIDLLTNGENSLPSRISLYHRTGTITLTVDNQRVDIDNIDIVLEQSGGPYFSKIVKNSFKFRNGTYGPMSCTFSIPKDLFNGQNDLKIVLSHYTLNWEVVEYNINIDVDTATGIISGWGESKLKSAESPYVFNRVETIASQPESFIFNVPGP